MTSRRRRYSCILLTIPLLGASAWGEDAGKMLDQLQKKYDSIRDASVAFTQHVRFGVMKSEQTFAGRFTMKKGNKYRIETEDQTIATDGKSVWSYSKATNQVVIDKYREDPRAFSPDRILTNVPKNYAATVLGKDTVGLLETSILKLIPKDSKSNLKWMKVWVDQNEWLMRRVQVLDVSDNLTTYTVSDIRLNGNMAEDQFQLIPPKDAEVIDLR